MWAGLLAMPRVGRWPAGRWAGQSLPRAGLACGRRGWAASAPPRAGPHVRWAAARHLGRCLLVRAASPLVLLVFQSIVKLVLEIKL